MITFTSHRDRDPVVKGALLRWLFICCLVVLGLPRTVSAGVPPNRTLLSPSMVATSGPVLANSDLVLLESNADGMLRQLTIMTLVRASPSTVRDVVMHPERYAGFTRNMSKSEVQHNSDGSLDHSYELSYGLITVGSTVRFVPLKSDPGQEASAIEIYDPQPGGTSWFRWEFVPYRGGTIAVLYGYTDLLHSGYPIDRLIQRVPTLQFGLAMIGQMTLLLTMQSRAEQLSPSVHLKPDQPSEPRNYAHLLQKGIVALLRKNQGKLSELALISASMHPRDNIQRFLSQPTTWSERIPSVSKSDQVGTQDGMQILEMDQSIPLLTFRTRFLVKSSDNGTDLFGSSGDLRGARLRFDLRPIDAQRTQVVFRSSIAYDRASLLLRQLYKLEPLFEFGVNLGLALVFVRGIELGA